MLVKTVVSAKVVVRMVVKDRIVVSEIVVEAMTRAVDQMTHVAVIMILAHVIRIVNAVKIQPAVLVSQTTRVVVKQERHTNVV